MNSERYYVAPVNRLQWEVREWKNETNSALMCIAFTRVNAELIALALNSRDEGEFFEGGA